MLEGNVEVIFSIFHIGLSWNVDEQPLKSPSHRKITLLQLSGYSCSNGPFIICADQWIYVKASPQVLLLLLLSSASQHRVAMLPKAYLQ